MTTIVPCRTMNDAMKRKYYAVTYDSTLTRSVSIYQEPCKELATDAETLQQGGNALKGLRTECVRC